MKSINKSKNKKPFIAICLLLVLAVGVTFAVILTSDNYIGLYNVTKYNVVVNENITSSSSWMPGEKISKNITATNNGDVDAVFRVKYVESWEDSNGDDITSSVPAGTVTINFENQEQWIYNSNDGYYYYKFILEPNKSTSSFVSGVTLNRELNDASSCEMNEDTYVCTNDFDGLAGAIYKISFTKETAAYRKYQQVLNTSQPIIEKQLYTLPYGRTESNLQIGDEICINGDTTECFNFIRYDGDNIVMLSKYNLKVGNIYDRDGKEIGEYTSADIGYGLQSSEAKGGITGDRSEIRYGTVAFSETNYWSNESNLKSEYGSSYPADVYDTDYSDASGNNYSIAYYVENYKNILETYGLTVQSARLLSISEVNTNVGCIGDGATNGTCPDGFIKNTSFWLSMARNNGKVLAISRNGTLYARNYYGDGVTGVRPVIVISKNDI